MEQKDNLLGVVKTLFKWRKQIATVCLVAFVGSIIISLLLPVYYKATTVFLAASPDQAKPDLLYGKGNFEPEYYGNESDIDRVLTISESNELVSFLVDSFQLYDHYNIDSTGRRARYKVRETLFDLYEVQKTKRDAIELTVEDKDPELAAKMANAARQKIDELAQQLIKEGQLQTIRSYEINLRNKEELLNVLSDSLSRQRQSYGIYNAESQSEAITSQFAKAEAKLIRNRGRLESLQTQGGARRDSILALQALVNGQEQEVQALQEKIDRLNAGMAKVNTLDRQYKEANQSLGEDKERYKVLVSTYRSNIPSIILVEKAMVPIIKSRPQRALIVVASVAIAFLFSVITVLLIDAYKEVDWREIIYAK